MFKVIFRAIAKHCLHGSRFEGSHPASPTLLQHTYNSSGGQISSIDNVTRNGSILEKIRKRFTQAVDIIRHNVVSGAGQCKKQLHGFAQIDVSWCRSVVVRNFPRFHKFMPENMIDRNY